MTSVFAFKSMIFNRPISWYTPLCSLLNYVVRKLIQFLPSANSLHLNMPIEQQPEEQQFCRLSIGKRALSLNSSAKFSIKTFNNVSGPKRLPLALREAIEGQQLFPCLIETLGRLRGKLRPFYNKFTIGLAGSLQRGRIDDPVIVCLNFLNGMFRNVFLNISKFMYSTALNCDAGPLGLHSGAKTFIPICDTQTRPPQTTVNQSGNDATPGIGRFTDQQFHIQNLLMSIGTYPKGNQYRGRHYLPCNPDTKCDRIQVEKNNSLLTKATLSPFFKNTLEPSHNSGDSALRQRCATKQGGERPFYSSLVGSGQICPQQGAIYRRRPSLIPINQRALPFLLSLISNCTGTGHVNGGLPKTGCQTPLFTAVSITLAIAGTFIRQCRKHFSQLCFRKGENHLTHLLPQSIRQRIGAHKVFHFYYRWGTFFLHRRVPPWFWPCHRPGFWIPRGYAFLISTTRGTLPTIQPLTPM